MIADLPSLMAECAPNVGPTTLMAIIKTESGGNPYAINDNTIRVTKQPKSYQEAVQVATDRINRGHSVDMGLAQINSKNLKWLGLTVSQVFDPCTNLKASAKVLESGYERAAKQYGPGQQALLASLSAYNTGSLVRGFSNGYVQKVVNNSGKALKYSIPAMPAGLILQGYAGSVVVNSDPHTAPLSVWEDKPKTETLKQIGSNEKPIQTVNYTPQNSPLQAQGF